MMVFHYCTSYIKKWLLQQSHVKEESLTDWLLFYVSNKQPCIYYQAFSRHEEAINGSDWEWWVLTPNCHETAEYNAYRFLVQAKKLLPNGEDNYPLLCYGNKNGLQIDLLLQAANVKSAFPLYMFYSIGKPGIKEQIKYLSLIDEDTLSWCETCDNGGFLASANEIYKFAHGGARRKFSDEQLLNHSYKLSLCDLLFSKSAMEAERALSRFNDTIIQQFDGEKDTKYNNRNEHGIKHFGKSIPKYVSLFLENRGQEISWFETEMHSDIGDLGGLGIIDLRSNNRRRGLEQGRNDIAHKPLRR